jgi:predicted CoA-substrate-specific enzyme activase
MASPAAYVGVDVGSVSVNVAGVTADRSLVGTPAYVRIAAHRTPVDALKAAVATYLQTLPPSVPVAGVGTTGSGRELTRHILRADISRTEIFAHAIGLSALVEWGLAGPAAPRPGTILEIGGQDSKVIVFRDGVPVYFNMNSICSAGTGEFLQQLADEIGLPVADVGAIAARATHPPHIDATCTVFIKRDFRHLTQKGVPLADRLMGICRAMVANYLRNVVGSSEISPPFYFQGGVAGSAGVRAAFEAKLRYPIIVPPYYAVMGAIGMAVAAGGAATGETSRFDAAFLERDFESRVCFCHGCHNNCEVTEPIEFEADGAARVLDRLGGRCERSHDPQNLHAMPARARALSLPMRPPGAPQTLTEMFALRRRTRTADGLCFGGIDGGSRGTKYAVIRCRDQELEVLGVGTLETGGDAIGAVKTAVGAIRNLLPDGARLGGIGTTGSAGELARDIITTRSRLCADYLSTEILAHFAWASWLFPGVGTVMDIGGNDAKIIIRGTGGLEFAMNDKCAAGTGAFIEAVAKRFQVPLEEYGATALASAGPARVAGRCAVFGESDIVHKSRSGYPTADLLLGVAHAICRTYLSDVAKSRELALPIVAQGGAFLNDAVLAAFREVLVLDAAMFMRHADPHYVIGAGALGSALLARLRYEEGCESAFKGFDAIARRSFETISLDCVGDGCGRQCSGVLALLEDGRPIAGYRSIDCPLGMFEGMIASERTEAHVRMLLEGGPPLRSGGICDAPDNRHPAGAHLSLPVGPHP